MSGSQNAFRSLRGGGGDFVIGQAPVDGFVRFLGGAGSGSCGSSAHIGSAPPDVMSQGQWTTSDAFLQALMLTTSVSLLFVRRRGPACLLPAAGNAVQQLHVRQQGNRLGDIA